MSYAYSDKLSAFVMPNRSRLFSSTRANAIHRDPTRVAHRAGTRAIVFGTVIVFMLGGCSLLVDADVPTRGSGSSAGSSHSAPTAGMGATIGTSTWLGLAGNENGGASSFDTTPSSANVAGSSVSSALATGGDVGGTANATRTTTNGGMSSTVNSTHPTTIAAMGGGGASTNGSANLGGSRSSSATGGTGLGSGGNGTASGGTTSSSGSTSLNCSAPNVFCDGFELGTSAQLDDEPKKADADKSWSGNGLGNVQVYSMGTVALDTGSGFDPATGAKSAKALAIHFNYTGDLTKAGGGVARLDRKLGLGTAGSVQIDFDFRYSGHEFYPFSLFCEYGDYELSFNLDTNTFTERRGSLPDGSSSPHRTTITIAYDVPNTEFERWRHLRLALDRGTRLFAVQLDGVSILAPTQLDGDLSGQDCSFSLGATWVGSETGSFVFDAYFDNVRIQVN